MAEARDIEAKLQRLRALRKASDRAAEVGILRNGLRDASNLVVAEAAEIVGERLLGEFRDDLRAAFDRLMIDPEETDPYCRGKIAISAALNATDSQDSDLFLRGIAHFQNSGPPGFRHEDAASALRANSAFALVRINHPKVLLILTDLLFDPSKVARTAAAEAFGASRSLMAVPLLRFKSRTGDASPDVTAACLESLLAIDPEGSIDFVGRFLDRGEEGIPEGAAIALGESRRPDALEILKRHWTKPMTESMAEVFPLAIAMTRLPAALDFLIGELAVARPEMAQAILSALVIHRHNSAVRSRIAAAIDAKSDAELKRLFETKFSLSDVTK